MVSGSKGKDDAPASNNCEGRDARFRQRRKIAPEETQSDTCRIGDALNAQHRVPIILVCYAEYIACIDEMQVGIW